MKEEIIRIIRDMEDIEMIKIIYSILVTKK